MLVARLFFGETQAFFKLLQSDPLKEAPLQEPLQEPAVDERMLFGEAEEAAKEPEAVAPEQTLGGSGAPLCCGYRLSPYSILNAFLLKIYVLTPPHDLPRCAAWRTNS